MRNELWEKCLLCKVQNGAQIVFIGVGKERLIPFLAVQKLITIVKQKEFAQI